MTRPQLDGYTDALARLHGKKPTAGDGTVTKTRSVKSRREKKTTRRR